MKGINVLLLGGLAYLLFKNFADGDPISALFTGASGAGGGSSMPADIGYTPAGGSARLEALSPTGARSGGRSSYNPPALNDAAIAKYPNLGGIPLTGRTISYANKGVLKQSTANSISGWNAVKNLRLDGYNYGGGAAAFVDIDPIAYNQATVSLVTSPTFINQHALSYYAGQTGAHVGGMTAADRAAWRAANLPAALAAYGTAGGYTGGFSKPAGASGAAIINKPSTTKPTALKPIATKPVI